jgi:anti-sigma regulatory factor (Ser/Thr protein kinase)
MRDLSLHLLDLVQNSITARADHIEIAIRADRNNGILEISVRDNGVGMDPELLQRVTDPFATTRTTRRVGLGIPLIKASAERAAGGLVIASEKGKGTSVDARFMIDNIDRPPLGDVAGTIVDIIISEPAREFTLVLENGSDTFRFDSAEIKERLGEVPITEYAVTVWMREYLNEGIKVIFGGVLNEIDS